MIKKNPAEAGFFLILTTSRKAKNSLSLAAN